MTCCSRLLRGPASSICSTWTRMYSWAGMSSAPPTKGPPICSFSWELPRKSVRFTAVGRQSSGQTTSQYLVYLLQQSIPHYLFWPNVMCTACIHFILYGLLEWEGLHCECLCFQNVIAWQSKCLYLRASQCVVWYIPFVKLILHWTTITHPVLPHWWPWPDPEHIHTRWQPDSPQTKQRYRQRRPLLTVHALPASIRHLCCGFAYAWPLRMCFLLNRSIGSLVLGSGYRNSLWRRRPAFSRGSRDPGTYWSTAANTHTHRNAHAVNPRRISIHLKGVMCCFFHYCFLFNL